MSHSDDNDGNDIDNDAGKLVISMNGRVQGRGRVGYRRAQERERERERSEKERGTLVGSSRLDERAEQPRQPRSSSQLK